MFGTTFLLPTEFPMNSGSKPLPKNLTHNTLVLSERLAFCARTSDVTYCVDVVFILPAMSGGQSPTVAYSLCQFLVLY